MVKIADTNNRELLYYQIDCKCKQVVQVLSSQIYYCSLL